MRPASPVLAAELWIAKEGYCKARLKIVGEKVGESGAREAEIAA